MLKRTKKHFGLRDKAAIIAYQIKAKFNGKEDLVDDFRQSWKEAMEADTIPLDEALERLDDED